jgi:hypothetical protein
MLPDLLSVFSLLVTQQMIFVTIGLTCLMTTRVVQGTFLLDDQILVENTFLLDYHTFGLE